MACIGLQLLVLVWVILAQPHAVLEGLRSKPIPLLSAAVWVVSAALVAGVAWRVSARQIGLRLAAYGALLATLLAELSWAALRDSIRDLTLASKGFDVWDRLVETNWSIVGLFLVVFVIGLGVVAWLVSVMMRVRPVLEGALP
jgi:hypothetical protein